MTLVVPFAMGLVASTPLLPRWSTAQFLELPAQPCRAKWEARLVSCQNGMHI
jgi:hypothetical protein